MKFFMTYAQISAGTKAEKVGHENEIKICDWLNSLNEDVYVVDGGKHTKRDIINQNTGKAYSIKSVSLTHTQCHLTTVERWCNYFEIDGKLRNWFDLFFGIPGFDVSQGKSRRHRLTKNQIPSDLNDVAVTWFNDNKLRIFDVIVCSGMSNTPIDFIIWYNKKTRIPEIYEIDKIEKFIHNGRWILNDTTLHFIDENGKKCFHLQMKGSGKKYTSGYHGMMFHIYKFFN